MIINCLKDLETILPAFLNATEIAFDTETTGLSENDRLFSLILACDAQAAYLNFKKYPDEGINECLDKLAFPLIQQIFAKNKNVLFYAHNAKFDLGMLDKEGISVAGDVWCTEAQGRVEKNNLMVYGLDASAKRIGLQKDDAVEEYITKHKLYTIIKVEGKKTSIKLKHFDRVPYSIITPYGLKDAKICLALGKNQFRKHDPELWSLHTNEAKLTKTCFKIERRGILIDPTYTREAWNFEKSVYDNTIKEFETLAGTKYPTGRNDTLNFFRGLGLTLPKTALENDSVNADFLENCEHPAAQLMVKARESEKRITTYYSSFLHLRDSNNVVHANMRQAGTETGRFSYSNPNFQNLPKEDEPSDLQKPYLVRGCLVPRPGLAYVAKDFEQQEYRMMLDYAGAKKLIDDVMAGMDVHQATANLVGISRKHAKTLNFAILYGAGAEKIAKMLGVSVMEAQHLKDLYFSRLPEVERLIWRVTQTGKQRGYIKNWFGRRCHVANREWAYVLPNHLIQGGCADVIKIAMNQIQARIDQDQVNVHMLLNVHDELLFEVNPAEMGYISDVITPIMENVYKPQNGMILTTSSSHSFKSYSAKDMLKGLDFEKAS